MYLLNIFLLAFFVSVVVDVKGTKQEKGDLKYKIFNDVSSVQKRNILQFAIMINCATGRSALDFNDYGNHCGLGGSGTPVDNIDRCCLAHDQCFKRNSHCWPKLILYKSGFIKRWRSSSQKCIIKCDDTSTCKFNVCECDRIAAECFASHPYNSRHKNTGWWGKRRR